jgi:hypothetical protein
MVITIPYLLISGIVWFLSEAGHGHGIAPLDTVLTALCAFATEVELPISMLPLYHGAQGRTMRWKLN